MTKFGKLTHAQLHPDFVQHTTTPARRLKRKLCKMFGHRQVKRNFLKCLALYEARA